MYFRRGRYFWGRNNIALGADRRVALHRYAELETDGATPGTFADAAKLYREQELPSKSVKTREEYNRQLKVLCVAFGHVPLDDITPAHVRQYMRTRGKPIAATREKALLSAVFNFARGEGLTTAANPCAGVRGKKAHRERYVTHEELSAVLDRADPTLAGFLELCYMTGQRPSDVLKMRRQDVQDGHLLVTQRKTGAKVRIAVVGALAAVLARLAEGPVASVWLVHDRRGQRFTLSAMQRRFAKLSAGWQIRDLRAKAASDADTSRHAQALLGHSAATTTDGYIRRRIGERVLPIEIAGKPQNFAGNDPNET
jgi:integrase